jgi:malonyl-CoA O-methyltransferase
VNDRLNTIRSQFNRSAEGLYDTHANVQRLMADWLAASIRRQKNGREAIGSDVLEIGCGTGVLTEMLVRDWPFVSITALDLAPGMLEAAKKRVGKPNVHYLLGDVEAWAAEANSASFDCLVSSACFQWLSRPKETLCDLRRLLRTGGLLTFTTFGPETFHELHKAFDEAYRADGKEPQRHGLTFRTADQWQVLLLEAGFSKIQYECSIQVKSYASVKDFLHSVKAVGASASEAENSCGLGSRRLFNEMFRNYEDKFSVPGGVTATYDLLLIHALAL